MILTEELKRELKEHALKDITKECCGLFVENKGVKYIPLENTSKEPEKSFRVDILDVERVQQYGQIIGIFHSHVDGTFSNVDRQIAEKRKLTSIIYKINSDEFEIYEPLGIEIPYVGREYVVGNFDCFTLVQDYYKRELNIDISEVNCNYRYSDQLQDIEENVPENMLTVNHLLENGFSKVKDLKKHDIILSKCNGLKFPTHYSIYLGNNKVLHQFVEDPSTIDDYSKAHQRMTVGIFRHFTNL